MWGPSCYQGGGVGVVVGFSVFLFMFTYSTVLNPRFLTPHLRTLDMVLGFIRGPGSPFIYLSAVLLVPETLPSPCMSSCSGVYKILIMVFLFSICW